MTAVSRPFALAQPSGTCVEGHRKETFSDTDGNGDCYFCAEDVPLECQIQSALSNGACTIEQSCGCPESWIRETVAGTNTESGENVTCYWCSQSCPVAKKADDDEEGWSECTTGRCACEAGYEKQTRSVAGDPCYYCLNQSEMCPFSPYVTNSPASATTHTNSPRTCTPTHQHAHTPSILLFNVHSLMAVTGDATTELLL
jgi:hypothetical protein